jgi:hypothetical protein
VLAVAVHPGAVLTEMAAQTAPESMIPCKCAAAADVWMRC